MGVATGRPAGHRAVIARCVPCWSLAATVWFLVIGGGYADVLVIEADAQSLTDPEAVIHEITVHYDSPFGIDISSLGDDDLVVGRHSLFGLGLGSRAPFARLVVAESDKDGRGVAATYALDQPLGGWKAWNAKDLTIQVEADSVRDLEGNTVPTRVIGILTVELAFDGPRPITTTLLGEPMIHDLLQPYVDIEVRYTSEELLTLNHFGRHDLSIRTTFQILSPSDVSLIHWSDDEFGKTAEVRVRMGHVAVDGLRTDSAAPLHKRTHRSNSDLPITETCDHAAHEQITEHQG